MAEVTTTVTVKVVKLNEDGSTEDLTGLLGRPCDIRDRKEDNGKLSS